MAAILKAWKRNVKSKIWLRQSMNIYRKNNLAKFYPEFPIRFKKTENKEEEQEE